MSVETFLVSNTVLTCYSMDKLSLVALRTMQHILILLSCTSWPNVVLLLVLLLCYRQMAWRRCR